MLFIVAMTLCIENLRNSYVQLEMEWDCNPNFVLQLAHVSCNDCFRPILGPLPPKPPRSFLSIHINTYSRFHLALEAP